MNPKKIQILQLIEQAKKQIRNGITSFSCVALMNGKLIGYGRHNNPLLMAYKKHARVDMRNHTAGIGFMDIPESKGVVTWPNSKYHRLQKLDAFARFIKYASAKQIDAMLEENTE